MLNTFESSDTLKDIYAKIPTLDKPSLIGLKESVVLKHTTAIGLELRNARSDVAARRRRIDPRWFENVKSLQMAWVRAEQTISVRLQYLTKFEEANRANEINLLREFIKIASDDLSPQDFREMAIEAGFTHDMLLHYESTRRP